MPASPLAPGSAVILEKSWPAFLSILGLADEGQIREPARAVRFLVVVPDGYRRVDQRSNLSLHHESQQSRDQFE
jgi:hypothetical protein